MKCLCLNFSNITFSCDSPVSLCPTVAATSREINAPPPTRPRFSRISCDDGPDADHTATPLLRKTAVNPRRSRRYATDFGLGRRPNAFTRVGTPFEDGSSLASGGSSPSTAELEAASDSDDLASLYDCAAADFPEPPPIGSPVIRRMRSSPWFATQILDINPHALSGGHTPGTPGMPIPAWSFGPPDRGVANSQHAVRPKASSVSKSGLVNESAAQSTLGLGKKAGSLELVGEALLDLDMNPLSPLPVDVPSEAHATTDSSELLQWSISHRYHPFSEEGLQQPKPTFSQFQSIHEARAVPGFLGNKRQSDNTQGRLPRIIRKVASMRSDTQRMDLSAQRPVPKSRSFRSILHTCEPHQTFQNAQDGNNTTLLLRGSRDIPSTNSHLPVSLPRSKKDQGKVRRHHLSAPFTLPGGTAMSMDSYFPESSSSPVGLHRLYCSDSPRKRCSSKLMLSRSFIDITPDEDGRHGSKEGRGREKVRDFISRAAGIFRWGKQPKPKH
ncbi:hypothetical protein M413DRAFT_168918 [Hebeloma cylindrosporum]|uniref:Uncharacterized protein n=1 Tax=Hebeloma cylindrosporum TaxID=76867 RepID=A0A0C3C758_HEBCY|nr:hypothetical protein M413DRAFT_168918 [Hebeloma cylindrosporum h7]